MEIQIVDVRIHSDGKVEVITPSMPEKKRKRGVSIPQSCLLLTGLLFAVILFIGATHSETIVHDFDISPPQVTEPDAIQPAPSEISAVAEPVVAMIEEAEVIDGFKVIDIPLTEEEQRYIYDLCKEYDVDYAVFLGQIWTESKFQSDAVSSTGDHGLVQLNNSQLGWISDRVGCSESELKTDLWLNVRGSLECWKYFKEKFPDLGIAGHLMCYNQGERSALKMVARGEISDYAATTLRQASIYGEMLVEN